MNNLNVSEKVRKLIQAISMGLTEKEHISALSLLTILSGENVFLYGLPGTAKSLIARRVTQVFKGASYFEYLMNKYSTPDELLGALSIPDLKEGRYKRNIKGSILDAEIAFLDEIWKSGSAILNILLTIINEKKYTVGEDKFDLPFISVVSASNETPTTESGLMALYDRFLTRINVEPIKEGSNFINMLKKGDVSSYTQIEDDDKISNFELEEMQNNSRSVELSEESIKVIMEIKSVFESESFIKNDVYLSDRRWLKIVKILKMAAFLNGRMSTNVSDCLLISYFSWSNADNRKIVFDAVEDIILNISKKSDKVQDFNRRVKDVSEEIKDLSSGVIEKNDIFHIPGKQDDFYKFEVSFNGNNSYVSEKELVYAKVRNTEINKKFKLYNEDGDLLNHIIGVKDEKGIFIFRYISNGKVAKEYKSCRTAPIPNIKKVSEDRLKEKRVTLLNKSEVIMKEIDDIISSFKVCGINNNKDLSYLFLTNGEISVAKRSMSNYMSDLKIPRNEINNIITNLSRSEYE